MVLYDGPMSEGEPLLVASAPMVWTTRLAALAAGSDPRLAADGGANHLARIGLRPQAVIGDLDSVSSSTRSWLGEGVFVHRPDQDRTDLDKAVEYCFDNLGLDRLTVLAALGGRPDHDLGNLGLLARMAMGENLVFLGSRHRILAVTGELSIAARPGETWSFWTYDPLARVTLEGLRWPVERARLYAADRPSISNEAIENEVRVFAEGGAVIVMRRFGVCSSVEEKKKTRG
jgi:thiamine pyrophosphokinase